MDNCVREMTRQELVAENNKLRDEIECKCKVIDEYYREKNDYQCKMKEMQKHIDCLKDELKSSQTYINCLESEKHNIRLRCHESAMDNFDNNMYGVLHVVTENELRKCTYDEQSHFIYENELLTTVHILSDELAKLRSQKGL